MTADHPTAVQRRYLRLGLGQPGGKLPLHDRNGQRIKPATIRACLDHGWAVPWTRNPIKPDWLVCRLTPAGEAVATAGGVEDDDEEGDDPWPGTGAESRGEMVGDTD
ncbi:hypothetical protein [Oceanibacterium hippocampi]|uniref:Uncharacterized protein n=1 Tax=Oceanibacterium hippocampi TaxID=745714 RepID=A0A1Y5SEU0_9PROT|nr:hypothetical protein [Oceanibacterium hippocampi]SLN37969.1 hypothetical protein OCH7691_01558 [Oceanibacterium hippocampi]